MVRGVDRAPIFLDDADRARFVDHLRRIAPEERATIYAWALMPNHVHLVMRSGPPGISRLMARLGTAHARAFNTRHGRVGHLFQDRFRSAAVESETHLTWLLRYVHRNPIEAGLVASLEALARHPWTGHRELVRREPAPLIDVAAVLSWFAPRRDDALRELRRWMEETDEAEPPLGSATEDPRLLERVVRLALARAARRCGIPAERVRSGSRDREASRARALAILELHERLGLPFARIERLLGLSRGSASRAVRRARHFVSD
jgi:REP element-mobilizing transposase RayT